MSEPIRVLLVEDQAMVRGALATLLDIEPDVEVVGQARDGQEGLELAMNLRPRVVVADIQMPRMSGIELAAVLTRQPDAPRVVLLTTFARPGYLERALAAGATGYVLKEEPASRLADAIRTVCAGGRVIHPDLAAEAVTDPDPLSVREREVLRLAADAMSTRAIASRLELSAGTVRNYLSSVMTKLGVSTRHAAIELARDKGWL